jgi:AcrR family transcriptional regulator
MPRKKNAPVRMPGSDRPAPLTTREHILDRTIYLMGKLGTTEVSVRTIAKEAGVNVAAVNYYFSSKEQMLEQMGERFLHGYGQIMKLLERPDLPPEVRLRRWASEVMHFLVEYPGVLSLMQRQMNADPLNPFGKALREGLTGAVRQLKATLKEIVGRADETRLVFKLTLLVSALAGPFPLHSRTRGGDGDFRSPGQQGRFLDLLLEHLRQ